MSHHLEFEQWLPFPLERLFAFFSNPENLPRIMPASSYTQLIALNRVPPPEVAGVSSKKTAGVGSSIVTSFRVLPFLPLRRRWVARITEFEWDRYFADVQDEGPFKTWHHRHEFARAVRDGAGGTLVRDVIEYEVGFGLAGILAGFALLTGQRFARILAIVAAVLSLPELPPRLVLCRPPANWRRVLHVVRLRGRRRRLSQLIQDRFRVLWGFSC